MIKLSKIVTIAIIVFCTKITSFAVHNDPDRPKYDYGYFVGINCNEDICTLVIKKEDGKKESYLFDMNNKQLKNVMDNKSLFGKKVEIKWKEENDEYDEYDENTPLDKIVLDVKVVNKTTKDKKQEE